MDFPTNGGDVWRGTAFIAAVQAQFIRTGGERGWEWTERVRKAELRLRRSSAPRLLAPQGVGRRAPQSHSPGAAPTSRPGRAFLRSLYRLHRVQGRRGGLCCGPASLRLQHKTRGVGAAPGSRVVARGLTPCLGEPGRAGEPAPRPLPGGPPGSAWRIQHAEHQD